MKGWRTYAYGAAVAAFGVAEAFDWTQIFTGPRRGVALLSVGMGIAVLRSITTTAPMCNGKSKEDTP